MKWVWAGAICLAGNGGMASSVPKPPPLAPAGVTTLRAQALSDSALVLTWTEVPSGLSVPTRYAVRYDTTDFAWPDRPDVLTGGCGAPMIGANATGGKSHACVLSGLLPDHAYFMQLVSYTGALNSTAVFGPVSNRATAVTMQRIGPMLVLRPRMFLDTIAITAASLPYDFGPRRYPVRGRFPAGDRVASFYDSTGAFVAWGYLLVVKP